MTAPIPEDQDQPPVEADDLPGEHGSDLPSDADDVRPAGEQEENAEAAVDEPSDSSGGE